MRVPGLGVERQVRVRARVLQGLVRFISKEASTVRNHGRNPFLSFMTRFYSYDFLFNTVTLFYAVKPKQNQF